jgi:hypothetical protein
MGEGVILRQNVALDSDRSLLAHAGQNDPGDPAAKVDGAFDVFVMMVIGVRMGMLPAVIMGVSRNGTSQPRSLG